ncbi:MAG: glycosyltransferase [Chloroflexi bacterium]|nr:glycosyltransferase [Chloroflexota bacterium]
MNYKPKVSIVTPSYNQAQFLEQTIQSVLSQTYPNIEYIVVDGASKDNSVEIIRKYEHRIAWWVSEPDKGQSEAVNKGWMHATGEIIGWLNSDDLLLPDTVTRMVNAFEETPEMGFIYGDVLSIDQHGDIFNVMRFQQWGIEDLAGFEIISQPGVFMCREILEQAGYLNNTLHYLMDIHLWLKMIQLAPMRYLPGLAAAARYHAGAKNVATGAHFGADAYKIVEWMKTQPLLQEILEKDSHRVWAGAHRISARYLLDAGDASGALRDYLRCFWARPATALPEINRILFSFLSLVGLGKLKETYYANRLRKRRKNQPDLYRNVSAFLRTEKQ